VGESLTAASIVLFVAMQAAAGVWFPPPISVSQYGIGPWGWIFSLWVTCISLAPVCLERALARRRTGRASLGRILLAVGLAGAFVMAVVRTQAGGAQTSLNAKVHMVGSIMTLACMPLGILALLWMLGRGWRWAGIVLTCVVACSLFLLLFAAAGYDTAGLGPHESWAFWQSVAVLTCVLLVGALAVAADQKLTNWMSDHTSEPAGSAKRSS
jgi:hypothetical protein